MAEQVTHALGVEDVAAAEFHSRVGAQLTREANVAQVVLRCTIILLAFGLEAGQAFGFTGDAAAGVTASLVNFLAGRDLCGHLDGCLLPDWAHEIRAKWLPVDHIGAACVRIGSLASRSATRGG